MIIGYIRPLNDDPNGDKQKEILKANHCEKIIVESHASAKNRIKLDKMVAALDKNDVVLVTKLYVLADSTHHLVDVLDGIEQKEAFLRSVKEGIDTLHSDYSFRYIVKHLAQFQSDIISEKTKKGMHKARHKGASPGRPRKPDQNVQRAILMYESKKYTLAEIRNETGISKSTLYRYLEN